MLCKKCGKEIPDNSKFCRYCGASLEKKINKKPFIIGGCCIAVIIICCSVFLVGKYMKEKRQEADIESAKTIAKSIEKTISKAAVSTDMQQYLGIVISLGQEGDLEYLPQSFQDEFKKKCGEIPDLQYTKDNAAGFSFLVNRNGTVSVYIASDKRLDEWKVYPKVSDRYYDGEKQEPEQSDTAEVIQNKEYSYVRLISKKSPILGYWQGEHAGMYVGYDTIEDEEGFVIYLYTSDKWVQILHDYEGYSMTGNMGQINYSKDGSNVDVVIKDESHITIYFQSDSYEGDDYISEYTFTKGEMDDSLMERFGGKWMGGITDIDINPDCEITYDKGYHFTERYGDTVIKCIHEITDRDGEIMNPVIVLYNGVNALCFLSPYGQLDVQEGFCFDAREFLENDGKMNYSLYIVNADGDEGVLYREDSEEYQMQKVLLAYYHYVNNLNSDYYGNSLYFRYKLIYVDDDDIPELVVIPNNGCIMCTYKDGEVIQLVNSSTSWLNYIEDSGYYQYGGMLAGEFYAKLEDGMGEDVAYRIGKNDEDGYLTGEYYCYIGDEEVSEEDYLDYLDSLPDDYVSATEDMYSTIYGAYENLN